MGSFSIPPVTLQPGITLLGPFTVPDTDSGVQVTLSRTQGAHPLNGLTESTSYSLSLQQSNDDGTTWQPLADAAGIPGGLIPVRAGGPLEQDLVSTSFNSGTGRQVQAQVTVTGPSPVTLSGSITTT